MLMWRGEQRQSIILLLDILQKQLAQDANIPNLTNGSKLTRTPFWPDVPVPGQIMVYPIPPLQDVPTWKELAEAMVAWLEFQLERTVTIQPVEVVT